MDHGLGEAPARGVVDRPSPNFTARRGDARPDMVVLHYTGMTSTEEAVARLCDPAAEVSAHYLIDADGTVTRLVAEDMRSWHAGVAAWGGTTDVNSHAIGIELANPGHEAGYPPFPEPQMAALEGLLGRLIARWSIRPERVLGHGCVAPGRKIDPGEKFDWRRLARQDMAVWLDREAVDPGPADAARFQHAARRFGYAVPEGEQWCPATLAVWRAFAMRFLPMHASERPRADGVMLLERLAQRWPCNAHGAGMT